MACPTPMNAALKEAGRTRRWNGIAYACRDKVTIHCRRRVTREGEGLEAIYETERWRPRTIPANGVLLRRGKRCVTLVSGARLSRDMAKIIRGGPGKTYALPPTVATVCQHAFHTREGQRGSASVRLNEGLEVLEEFCFLGSGIRRLVLPSSVRRVGAGAFQECGSLRCADLRAARGLKELGQRAFSGCGALGLVLLGEGLETICADCFAQSRLEEMTIPGSVRRVEQRAFSGSSLRSVRFLGATEEGTALCSE